MNLKKLQQCFIIGFIIPFLIQGITNNYFAKQLKIGKLAISLLTPPIHKSLLEEVLRI